jgi:hypothetical protein
MMTGGRAGAAILDDGGSGLEGIQLADSADFASLILSKIEHELGM